MKEEKKRIVAKSYPNNVHVICNLVSFLKKIKGDKEFIAFTWNANVQNFHAWTLFICKNGTCFLFFTNELSLVNARLSPNVEPILSPPSYKPPLNRPSIDFSFRLQPFSHIFFS